MPSTDPDQPYLAYAEEVDGVVQVVVLDVRDESEVARVPVPDAKKWGGWVAPPVALGRRPRLRRHRGRAASRRLAHR